MASIKGKCTNLAGCSLAYTKQPVSVPDKGDFRCPECGQPLQPFDAGKPMKKPALAMILGGIGLLAAAAIIFFLVWPKLHPPPVEMVTTTGTPAATVAAEPSGSPDAKPSAAVQPSPSAPLTTPASPSTPTAAAQADAEAQTTPTAPAVPAPASNASSAVTANSPATTPASAADGNDEGAQVKKQVLERIDAMPKLSASDRTKLYEAVDRARGMSKLAVILFEPGRTTPAQAAVVQLGERLRSADAQRLLDDPTVIVVVLGYADAKGSEKSNLQISGDRAENLAKVLRDQVKVMNVLHAVGMGTSKLFSKEQLEKNRIAEVWAVLP